MVNDSYEKLNQEQFICRESWKKQKTRLQEQYPYAKITYSYKTKQFTIRFELPDDFYTITDIKLCAT